MGSCLGCMYGCCCCEFNFAIFPHPQSSYTLNSSKMHIATFDNENDEKVPYLYLPRKNHQFNIIYFHGNAEDLGYSAEFLQELQEQMKAEIYAIEYPCYGVYQRSFTGRISNGIKENALNFYDFLSKTKGLTPHNTVVLGRSIGSGGACYLAKRRSIQNLMLISPFSTIPAVAKDFVGCLGCLVKEHFNNIQEIHNYNGRLLVIHGKKDEVINFRHGEMIVQVYEERGSKCTFITPPNMSHNYFVMERDIIAPIKEFTEKI